MKREMKREMKRDRVPIDSEISKETANFDKVLSFKRQVYTCSCLLLLPTLISLMRDRSFKRIEEYEMITGFNRLATLVLHHSMQAVGDIIIMFCLYRLGRKVSVVVVNIFMMISIVIFVSDSHATVDFVGYISMQIAMPCCQVTFFVYIAESVPSSMRIFFMGSYYLFYNLGTILNSILLINDHSKSIFAFTVATGSCLISVFAMETPYYLACKGQREKAEAQWIYLHGGNADTTEALKTFDLAEEDAQRRKSGMIKLISSRRFAIPIIVSIIMQAAHPRASKLYSALVTYFIRNSTVLYFRHSYYIYDEIFNNLTQSNLNQLVVSFLGCILFEGSSFFLSRRVHFLGSVILSYSMFLLFLLPRKLFQLTIYGHPMSEFFSYLGGEQLILIIPVEIAPGSIRDLVTGTVVLIELLLTNVTDFSRIFWLRELDPLFFSKVRWLSLPAGLVLFYSLVPETKNLTLFQAEEKARYLLSDKLFSEAETEE